MRIKVLSLMLFALNTAGALALSPSRVAAAPQINTDLPRSVGEVIARMKPMQLMHLVDTHKKGVVTKEQYMKFFEDLWDRMDPDHTGTVSKEVWMHGWAKRNQ